MAKSKPGDLFMNFFAQVKRCVTIRGNSLWENLMEY